MNRFPGWGALLALLLLAAGSNDAHATKHRRPYNPNTGVNAHYDDNGGGGGCVDYTCGGNCYDGHTGTDFNLGIGNDVLAGASGTVTEAVSGCPNYGGFCSPCGGRCGNHVRIRHADGGSTLYCHMQDGSLTVGVGNNVGCGQKIGQSASSGCSTGPHLHFGYYPPGRGATDPYSGGCSNGGGGWVDQGPYNGSPSPECENVCECNPGEVQDGGCGHCGTHSRTCGGDCHWGGWSACVGEGPCGPGQQESRGCCDCGSQVRTCGGNCQWGDFGECGGPDPPGPPPCPTGEPGDCATGAVRCVTGCIACVQTVFPLPEKCDAHDNDCDATTDEEAPEMGEPPPPHAAQLEDLSAPEALRPGEHAEIWAVFRNVGTSTWPARTAWITATAAEGDEPSPLGDAAQWAAHDAPAGVSEAVAPGETATLVFPVAMPQAMVNASTRFDLVVQGALVMCPQPGFDFEPVRLAFGESDPSAGAYALGADAGEGDGADAAAGGAEPPKARSLSSAGGCQAAPGAPPALGTLVLPLLLLRRRRS